VAANSLCFEIALLNQKIVNMKEEMEGLEMEINQIL